MSEFLVIANKQPLVIFSSRNEALAHASRLSAALGSEAIVAVIVDKVSSESIDDALRSFPN